MIIRVPRNATVPKSMIHVRTQANEPAKANRAEQDSLTSPTPIREELYPIQVRVLKRRLCDKYALLQPFAPEPIMERVTNSDLTAWTGWSLIKGLEFTRDPRD